MEGIRLAWTQGQLAGRSARLESAAEEEVGRLDVNSEERAVDRSGPRDSPRDLPVARNVLECGSSSHRLHAAAATANNRRERSGC